MSDLLADINRQGFMRAANKAAGKRAKAAERIRLQNERDQAAWLARCVEASRKRYAEIDALDADETGEVE